MTPISQTSERPIDIAQVHDQTKICLYLGQERIMANSVRFATADNWYKVP